MGDERIRNHLELLVISIPVGAPGPATCTPGSLIEYEDGRWQLWIAGVEEPVRGDSPGSGGREAVALLLRVLGPSRSNS